MQSKGNLWIILNFILFYSGLYLYKLYHFLLQALSMDKESKFDRNYASIADGFVINNIKKEIKT